MCNNTAWLGLLSFFFFFFYSFKLIVTPKCVFPARSFTQTTNSNIVLPQEHILLDVPKVSQVSVPPPNPITYFSLKTCSLSSLRKRNPFQVKSFGLLRRGLATGTTSRAQIPHISHTQSEICWRLRNSFCWQPGSRELERLHLKSGSQNIWLTYLGRVNS